MYMGCTWELYSSIRTDRICTWRTLYHPYIRGTDGTGTLIFIRLLYCRLLRRLFNITFGTGNLLHAGLLSHFSLIFPIFVGAFDAETTFAAFAVDLLVSLFLLKKLSHFSE